MLTVSDRIQIPSKTTHKHTHEHRYTHLIILLTNTAFGFPVSETHAGTVRKGVTKVFKDRLARDHFPTVKRMFAPDWAHI